MFKRPCKSRKVWDSPEPRWLHGTASLKREARDRWNQFTFCGDSTSLAVVTKRLCLCFCQANCLWLRLPEWTKKTSLQSFLSQMTFVMFFFMYSISNGWGSGQCGKIYHLLGSLRSLLPDTRSKMTSSLVFVVFKLFCENLWILGVIRSSFVKRFLSLDYRFMFSCQLFQ